MNTKIDLSQKLDFNDIDLTAPDKIIEEFSQQISEQTRGIVTGNIMPYDGKIFSYTKHGFGAFKAALEMESETVDIQTTLGVQGNEAKKFEFYLSTPSYTQYKYRICYIKYGVSNYPVTVVLDQSVVSEINPEDANYVLVCNTRAELESLFLKIIYSRKVIKVMQELIRINQVQKNVAQEIETSQDEEA